jgi:hypothetical protein
MKVFDSKLRGFDMECSVCKKKDYTTYGDFFAAIESGEELPRHMKKFGDLYICEKCLATHDLAGLIINNQTRVGVKG